MRFKLNVRSTNIRISRYIVAAIAWGTSAFVLSLSAVAAHEILDVKSIVAFAYPWLALLVMTAGWIVDKRVSKFWTLSGTLSAAYAISLTGPLVLFYAPLAILFAVFLVMFQSQVFSSNEKALFDKI